VDDALKGHDWVPNKVPHVCRADVRVALISGVSGNRKICAFHLPGLKAPGPRLAFPFLISCTCFALTENGEQCPITRNKSPIFETQIPANKRIPDIFRFKFFVLNPLAPKFP
jgi:hypothetical protein